MNDWKSTETAPKDGTYVLLYLYSGRMVVAGYDSNALPGRGKYWNDGEYTFSPSHWMPLPDPPKELP